MQLANTSIQNDVRYKFIDKLKILSIFFVLLYHVGSFFIIFNNATATAEINTFLSTVISVCVPVFIMCNGFLLFGKKFNLTKHIKKTIKIIFLIVLWSTILVLVQYPFIKESLRGGVASWIKLIFDFKIGCNNHLWFLKALVLIYLLFPVLKWIFERKRWLFILILIIFCVFTFSNSIINSIVYILNVLFPKLNAVFPKELIKIFPQYPSNNIINTYMIPYFMLGGIMFNAKHKIKQNFKPIATNICFVLVIVLSMFLSLKYCSYVQIHDVVFYCYNSIFTLIMSASIFILGIVNDNEKPSKLTSNIAKQIFGIYLLNYPIINYLNLLFSQFINMSNAAMKLPLAVLVFVIGYFISWLLNRKLFSFLFKL